MIDLFSGAADGPPPPSAALASPPSWLVLSEATGTRADDGVVRPRRVLFQVAAAALVVACVVAIAGALISRRVAEQQSVHDVAEFTDVLAQSVVQPALTDELLTDPALAQRILDPLIRADVLSATLVRVKLWTPDATILYSDEARLVGRQFTFDSEARTALTTPQIEASVSDLSRPENQFERGDGRLLEVYRPVWTPSGHPLLFETYFRYDAVNDRSDGLWRGFAGIILSSLLALLLLLTPIVWSLLRRTRQAQDQRQTMMLRALASSDAERSRIAASLHDGVVQQLVASSLELAGRGERAAAAGDAERAADLRAAAATIRGSVGALRTLLVEIYPPNLTNAGLATALRGLPSTMTGSESEIVLDIDEDACSRLDPPTAEAVFRVVQEALRNAVKHSRASTITVSVYQEFPAVLVDVDDDGIGFDALAQLSDREWARDGHFGLQLMADAARDVGAGLRIASALGQGTHYRMELYAS